MAGGFDPYHKWLGIPRDEQPPHHYRLLGIPTFEDDPQVIEAAAERQMAFLRKFQVGAYASDATRLLNEIARARLCLLKVERKAAYDARLQAEAEPTPEAELLAVDVDNSRERRRAAGGFPAIWKSPAVLGGVTAFAIFGLVTFCMKPRTENPPAPKSAEAPLATAVDQTSPPAAAGKTSPPEPAENAPAQNASESRPQVRLEPAAVREPPAVAIANRTPSPARAAKPETQDAEPQVPAAKLFPTVEASKPAPAAPQFAANNEKPAPAASALAGQVAAKADPPEKSELDAARKELKERFKSEYAQSKKREGKLPLARRLAAEASQAEGDPATQYAMLSEAAELAAQAGDWELAQTALDELCLHFRVEPLVIREQMVSAAAAGIKSFDEASLLLVKFSELAAAAEKANDYAMAVKAMQSAAAAFKKPVFKPLRDQALQDGKRFAEYQAAYEAAVSASEKLIEDPQDSAANLTWGRFLCFYKGEWERGLPLLAQAGDKTWQPLAERELHKPQRSSELIELGDDWFRAGEKEKDPIRFYTGDRADAAWQAAWQAATKLETPQLAQQLDQRFTRLFGKSVLVTTGDPEGVTLPGTEGLDPRDEFTIEFWVSTVATQGVLISKLHTMPDISIQLGLREGCLSPQSAKANTWGGTTIKDSINDGRWHHVALVRQKGILSVYQDGERKGQMGLIEQYSSVSPWKLGCAKYGGPPCAARFARIRLSGNVRYSEPFTPKKQLTKDTVTLYLR